MSAGIPSGQGPSWFGDFVTQSGPQQGQAGYYVDQYSDIARQYTPQIQDLVSQYGQEAVYNPAFMRQGRVNFQEFNPFQAETQRGTSQYGDFQWEYNPFTGLSDLGGALDYLGHYTTHYKDAMKNQSVNDQRFFQRYGAYAPNTMEYGNKGSALYGNTDQRRMQAVDRARQDYDYLIGIQQRYGY